MEFQKYVESIGKSAKTAKNYAGAIAGPISQWALEENIVSSALTDIDSPIEFERIAKKIRTLPIYLERNTVGKGMYNAAINSYSMYLADVKGIYLETDLAEILGDAGTSETEKKTLISTRIGQGEFRKQLIYYWKGCAATGFKNTRLLVASHIKPWRHSTNKERLDVSNGLLLTPNLDKAFDIGYISFNNSGGICISEELEEPNLLGVEKHLSVSLSAEHIPYIEHHYENIYKQ